MVDSGGHIFHRDCGDVGCIVCNGGLLMCETCGGAEAALPTECPGRKMSAEEMDLVQSGVDYVNGQWV